MGKPENSKGDSKTMNLKRIKTTLAAGVLAASMIMPGLAVCAAPTNPNGYNTVAADTKTAITKTVKSPEGISYEKTFTFKFEQVTTAMTDSGVSIRTEAKSIPDATVTVKSENAGAADTNGIKTATANLTDALNLTNIDDAGLYIYTVTEVDNSSSDDAANGTWTYDTTKYRMRVYATWKTGTTHDNKDNLEYTISLIKLDSNLSETGNKVATADFTNYVEKTTTFTLTKGITDNNGVESMNQLYEFDVTFDPYKAVSTAADATITWKIVKDGQDVTAAEGRTVSGTVSDNKLTGVKLLSGESVVFSGVPVGTKATVEEKKDIANVDYTKTAITVSDAAKSGTISDDKVKVTDVVVKEKTGDKTTTVTYNNTWQTLTVTGVVTDIAPYITLVVVAIAGIAAYIGFKKRIAR